MLLSMHRLRFIALPLLLGIVTTIAVSWLAMPYPGNSRLSPNSVSAGQRLGVWADDDGKFWLISRSRNAWHTTVRYWHIQMSGLSITIPAEDYEARKFDFTQLPGHFRPDTLSDLHMTGMYHATGWPLPALGCSVHWKQQIRNSNITCTVRGGIQLPRDADFYPRALPVTPIWPGFLVNTLLYACLWFAGIRGAHTLRARRRVRRDLCPNCAYSRTGLSADSPCPECGRE